jgi:hypothetical protein
MSDFNLEEKFPDMRPIHKAPSLGTVNGIGTRLAGRRDYDDETGTYVATHCFSIVYVPVVALSAYRVADAGDGGWYFIGRVPLSRFAKIGNALLVLLVLGVAGFFGWRSYTGTADYKAGQVLAEADRCKERGEGRRAAQLYRQVMTGGTAHAGDARNKLQNLIESPPDDMNEAAGVFEQAVDLHRQNQLQVPDLYEKGEKLALQNEQSDPKGALALLDVVAPLAEKPIPLLTAQKSLLEKLVKKAPDDPAIASRLAVVYWSLGDPQNQKRAQPLLERHEARLGELDGAALLGQLYAQQGKHEKAEKLLSDYLAARLPRLRAAEKSYNDADETAQKRVFALLETGKAPGFDYQRYKTAPEAEQRTLLGKYIIDQIKDDSSLLAAQKELMANRAVVPAALDLGLVQLQRAQAIVDPEQRKKALERAEESFLSVRGQAGKTDAYRLNLGQVYYWLGKHAEGKALLDELLKEKKRASEMLLAVARLLREVGSITEARSLAEEAWKGTAEVATKQAAATARALMFTDLEDKITWLERANTRERGVKALLEQARGSKARQDGNDEEAVTQYRKALATYAELPENAGSLNNSALVHFELYGLTHDREQFIRGTDKLDRALALQPGNSILLTNAASEVLLAALGGVIGDAIDLKVLKRRADLDLLAFLYRDKASEDKLVSRLRTHPGYLKARGYYEKLMVLAPRQPGAYGQLATLHAYLRDLEGLQRVWQKLQTVEVDREQNDQEILDFFAGRKDDKYRSDMKKGLARVEATLQAARAVKGTTFAVAAASAISSRISSVILGEKIDADALVKLAEEALEAAPSSAVRGTLIQALSFRAHQALIREEPAYAKLATRTERSLGTLLLTWVLAREGALRDKALANADVKRALALKVEQVKAFPNYPSQANWAMLRAAHPAEAEQIAKACRDDKIDAIKRKIDQKLSPLSASVALSEYWMLLMAGKDSEADEVLARAAKRGIPMPAAEK